MLYWCKYLFEDYRTILQGILKNLSAVPRPVDSQLAKVRAALHLCWFPHLHYWQLARGAQPVVHPASTSTKPSLRSIPARGSSLHSRLTPARGHSDSCCLKISVWKVLHLSSLTVTTSLNLALNFPRAKWGVESPLSLECSTVVAMDLSTGRNVSVSRAGGHRKLWDLC